MEYEHLRKRMVAEQLVPRGIFDDRVLDAMGRIPRHEFVPEASRNRAYDDCALPLSHGQTISQPYMVAVMTSRLALTGVEKVLEIGTGSGYQSAVLAELALRVHTIERIPELTASARETLDRLGYGNVEFLTGDGTLGWPEMAPFDRILVTAGAPGTPEPLLGQLAMGGRIVLPVGSRTSQRLAVIVKTPEGVAQTNHTMCVFVPLIGRHGWEA